MLKTLSTTGPVLRRGKEYELPEREASEYIRRGIAEKVRSPAGKKKDENPTE